MNKAAKDSKKTNELHPGDHIRMRMNPILFIHKAPDNLKVQNHGKPEEHTLPPTLP